MATQLKVQLLTPSLSSAEWASINPILKAGEQGYDTTLKQFKVGDGQTAWNSLEYASAEVVEYTQGAGLDVSTVDGKEEFALDSQTQASLLLANSALQPEDEIEVQWLVGSNGAKIDIDLIPHAALERCVVVQDETARFALTVNEVQTGDTVKQTSTGEMFFVKDETKLNEASGYEPYTQADVQWSNIQGKPSSVSKAEAEDDQDSNTYFWSPQRVWDAINKSTSAFGKSLGNADDADAAKTLLDLDNVVENDIEVIAGTGLEGGGALTQNVTVGLSSATQADIAKGVTAEGWGDHSSAGYALDKDIIKSVGDGLSLDVVSGDLVLTLDIDAIGGRDFD